MKRIKNLKINLKKTISVLLTTTVLSTLAGCCFENHEEKIENQNKTISSLEQEKANLEQEKANLQEQLNQLKEAPQPTAIPESNTSYNNQESISSNLIDLYSTYSCVGDEFKSLTGDICRRIRKHGDDVYASGIYNVTKNRIDLPCKTYDYISKEYKSATGDICRKISVPYDGDGYGFIYGIYNVTKNRIDIPCKTYDYISDAYKSLTGDICKRISVPYDEGFAKGVYNVTKNRIDVPCKTYEKIEEVEAGIYQCITQNGQIKIYNYTNSQKN